MGRYCVMPAEGRAVLLEYAKPGCMAMAKGLPAIGAVRRALIYTCFDVAERDSGKSPMGCG